MRGTMSKGMSRTFLPQTVKVVPLRQKVSSASRLLRPKNSLGGAPTSGTGRAAAFAPHLKRSAALGYCPSALSFGEKAQGNAALAKDQLAWACATALDNRLSR